MPRPSLTPSQQQAIRQGYAMHGARALAEELRIPLYMVKNLVYREKLRRNREHSKRKPLNLSDEDYLRTHYPHQPTAQIATALGRSPRAVYRMAYRLGLSKTEAYLATAASGRVRKGEQRGQRTQFRKGHPPHNKGKKMPAHVYAKVKRTMFHKGNLPHNTKYDGHIRVRRDMSGVQYMYIRVALGKYVLLHRHLWVQAHGPIKPGHVIAFKDGNQGNCTLANLEMITIAERMRRNCIYKYPPEIRNVMRLLGQLNKELKKHGEEQDGRPAGAPVPDIGNAAQRRNEARSGTRDQRRGPHPAGKRQGGDQVHGNPGPQPRQHAPARRVGCRYAAKARTA